MFAPGGSAVRPASDPLSKKRKPARFLATLPGRRYTGAMRILAIDYGSVRVGLALSDPTGTLARPLPFLPAATGPKLAREIAALAQREEVHLILLGLPRNMDGSSGEAAARVQAFASVLEKATPIPVQLIDERLSTVQASRQQRDRIDSEAACVLLQAHLDRATPFPLLPPDA
jgi:putative Holliday junction resolvase